MDRASRRGLSPRLWLAGGWLLLALLAAIFAPLVTPQDPLAQDLMLERLPPFWLDGAEPGYWLGTDSLGRDLLSRLIFGGRIAFIVAFAAAIAACLVGSTLGLIAGYFGGWADRIISRIVDIWMAFPPVLFAILLVAVLGTGLSSVILAIAIIDWTRFCRVIRAEAMGQSRMDYVENARIAGYGRIGIMLREVLPNVVPSIVALLSLEMGIAVIVEAILSFVNLSISTDDPTWGSIIAEGRLSIHQAWWVLVFPLITLILTVLSFSQFGEALKARFDPVLR
ncbi:ABC transporter permease [Mesorhizobium loti]|uniref:ABC transporter permease n=2 Tax=Mesorhizobium TaxID=68287 RepID=A0A1A5ITC5_RHILI|nr:ABC transporter permease subunit [Mesorhizobium japonicum]OBP73732.1 ABC transporter permease [Mesorhizobium loti]QGX75585.1 ABC transporter permease [Mesorhizobium japonicum R7A]MUT26631.1 ABC transporter permease subunit [Mesorhizobium japonicum]OBP76212.1 ABC transporter permease [Mesorhizobium loti]